ncbi:MAG: rhamnogalacturonan acetylesterase [Williamsia sp.]|nr:rhamnogalacturonan acetylesterase [Williamsia sp.]
MNLSRIALIASCFVYQSLSAQTLPSWKFDFGPGKTEKGYTQVLPSAKYSDQTGYGFYGSAPIEGVDRKGADALRTDYCTSQQPFFFTVKLPEGNYRVKVISGDEQGASVTTIKAECRRLMVEKVETQRGRFQTSDFNVHVRDTIIKTTGQRVRIKPREREFLHWDNQLTLEFNNKEPKICAVEITPASDLTTVFLAGNSTVVDQANEPWAAWGQIIPVFFRSQKIVVANYAESGETLSGFIAERRLEKVFSSFKAGDYLFIEFAHNDQKQKGEGIGAFTSYKRDLKNTIREVKKRGGIPVLVTSMQRRSFDSTGYIMQTLGDYPEAMRQTAQEEQVALIDLNNMSKTMYEAWGPEKSIKAFVHYPANTFPGQDKELKDNTHFNSYGAYEIARCIVKGIQSAVPALAVYLKKDIPAFDPAHPDAVENWQLPPSPFVASRKPDGN